MPVITPKNQEKYQAYYAKVNFVWKSPLNDPENRIEIGENVTFRPPCTIYWGGVIGNNCSLSHNCVVREKTIIGQNSKIGNGTTLDGHLKIRNHVSVHTNCFIANYTQIHDHVFIGPGCTITNVRKIKHGRDFPLKEETAVIEDGVRIGGGCTILPGIHIGKEALIGAGSVVTKDIPPEKIALGVPAKVVRNVPSDELLKEI